MIVYNHFNYHSSILQCHWLYNLFLKVLTVLKALDIPVDYNMLDSWFRVIKRCSFIYFIHSFIHTSMALQPFVGSWPLSLSLSLLQFHNLFSTDGRTPWTSDQPVARGLPTHRTKPTQNKRKQTFMSRVGFEPRVPAFERGKTLRALDRAVTVIGIFINLLVQNGRIIMNNEFERMWKEAIVIYFKSPSQNVPWGIEYNHENLQSGLFVSGSWFISEDF
jgi:hypothetical protein